jgi:hypothetical protein
MPSYGYGGNIFKLNNIKKYFKKGGYMARSLSRSGKFKKKFF